MTVQRCYRKTEAQKLTFEILECSEDLFDGVNVEDCNALKERLRSIEELNLSGYSNISDLSIVAEMTNLKQLDFSRTEVAGISWAKSLKHLKIIRFSTTPVSGLVSLAQLKKLEEIRANHCDNITQADIEAIFDLPSHSLKYLSLKRTSKDLDSVLRRMKEKYPQLTIRYEWVIRR